MRHQVERPKHVAPKHGVKPVCALTAALVAVAMMATMAVTSLTPSRNANAADADNKAGIYKPTSVILGTDTGVGTEDTGIATYVGGDMYVGQKVSGDMKNPSGPAGSYAAEAEGLTAVKGKLLLHPLKGVWTTYYTNADGAKNGYVKDYRGFRFGIVGFGSQYRPKDGSSVLEVRGESLDNDINWVGGAEAWGNAGWIGKDNTKTKEPSYTANIADGPTTVFGGSSNSIPGKYGSANTHKYDSRPSVYVPSDMSGSVNWKKNDDNIGNTGKTFSDFGEYIENLSNYLSGLQKSESVNVAYPQSSVDPTYKPSQENLVRTKYDGSYSFTINHVNEKVIQFTGDGTSSMQVFNLQAPVLNKADNNGYTGVSFVFKNIPDSSSVVINVRGADKVDFHNGWRFWWTDPKGHTKELGGSYTDPDYAKRAQQIMWNFADASSVTIRGGQGSGTTTRKYPNSAAEKADGVWDGSFPLTTNDDPAAGMLGSILVPKGSFESRVSTNGRVWVGGNYAMYNPKAVGNTGQDGKFHEFVNYERSHSASALDMDQERHNLPWNGSYSTQGAAIAWDKVDASNPQKKLDNTTWAVYASTSDAQNQSNALKTVTDNAYGDDDSNQGSFSIGGLNPSAIYYIREVSANDTAYATNPNIYAITAGGEGSTARVVTNVYDSEGKDITDSDKNKKLLPSAGNNSTNANAEIANEKRGTIEWSKVDDIDKETLLGGSAWTLSKMSGETTEQSWNITDDQSGKRITITDANNKAVTSDTPITFEGNNPQKFTATAYDQHNQVITDAKLTWSSNNVTVASVDQNGTVTPKGNGTATITVKSADGNVTASFTVKFSGVTVETSVSINDYTNEISLEKGKTLKLTASVAPKDNTVEWSSSAANVSLSATTGTSVTLTANSVTSSPVIITAKETRTGKIVTLKVNVTKPPATTTTVFFKMQDNFNQNNGQKLFLEWKTSNGNWPADNGDQPNRKEMTVASGCNGYVSYTINEVMPTSASFRIRRDKAGWTTPGSFYRPGENSGFAFNGGDIVTLNTATEILDTAPSGCAVTSTVAYSSRRVAARSGEHRAVASVLRTQSNVVNVAGNSTVSSKQDEDKQDEDTAAGKFKVSGLADGTYHLQETHAPNGYKESEKVYTITITDGKARWSSGDSKITNDRKTGTVTWTKMSSDFNNTEPLSGSQWTLKQTKTFSWENGVAKYTDVTSGTAALATVTDNCVNDAGCSTQIGKYADLDSAAGKFKIDDLDWGEYELIESKAPDGYNIDKRLHTFRIGPAEGSDVTGKWYTSSSFHPEATAAYNETTAFTIDGGTITNTPGVVLPDTGGEGLNKMYAAGFLAVAIAVAGLALSLRRRQ